MVPVSYLDFYGTFLQNATKFITYATAILLQDTTKIYFRMCQFFYYKKATL